MISYYVIFENYINLMASMTTTVYLSLEHRARLGGEIIAVLESDPTILSFEIEISLICCMSISIDLFSAYHHLFVVWEDACIL